MRKARRAIITVEPIESRNLLSTVAPTLSAAAVADEVSTQIYPPPLLITGTVRGTAIVRRGISDVGDLYTLGGAGRVGPMGQVNVSGYLQTTSLTGRPIGTVALSNRYGMVEVRITGSLPPYGSTSPGGFTFQVARATGRYARLAGTGGVLELAVGRVGKGGLANFRMDINPVMIARSS